jgi:hypothetical protein
MNYLEQHLAEAQKMLARIGREPEQRVDRGEFAATLKALNINLSKQTLAKIACTGTDGPEYQIAFGRAYYLLGPGVAWALGRFSKPRRSSFEGAA